MSRIRREIYEEKRKYVMEKMMQEGLINALVQYFFPLIIPSTNLQSKYILRVAVGYILNSLF